MSNTISTPLHFQKSYCPHRRWSDAHHKTTMLLPCPLCCATSDSTIHHTNRPAFQPNTPATNSSRRLHQHGARGHCTKRHHQPQEIVQAADIAYTPNQHSHGRAGVHRSPQRSASHFRLASNTRRQHHSPTKTNRPNRGGNNEPVQQKIIQSTVYYYLPQCQSHPDKL